MITLRADNRVLAANSKYSYLLSNCSSGVGSVQIANTEGFSTGSFVVIGEFGSEESEMFRVGTVDTSGNLQLLTTAGSGTSTAYSHPESTKVTVLAYNQIQFYWTAATGTIADETPTFDTNTPLGSATDITPSDWYTTYADNVHSTGFGWFVYSNSVTATLSVNSNPIPYAGFNPNTVQQVFSDFDSLLNVNELKLVTVNDKLAWLNEALAVIKNKLNLTNVEYTVSVEQSISVVSGTQEYQLPDDFSELVYITDGSATSSGTEKIPYISLNKIGSYSGSTTCHYIRNRYIGFVPLPSTAATYYYRYRAKATRVTSLSDYIDLPDNAFYSLKDWMLYRAGLKFQSPQASSYLQSFTTAVNLYMQAAVKRDSNLDSWGISSTANV